MDGTAVERDKRVFPKKMPRQLVAAIEHTAVHFIVCVQLELRMAKVLRGRVSKYLVTRTPFFDYCDRLQEANKVKMPG